MFIITIIIIIDAFCAGIGTYGKSSNQDPGMESEIVNEPVEDDAQTKFYKQHMVKSQVPGTINNPSARDFDTWSSERITKSFQRRQLLKDIHRAHEEDEKHAEFRKNQVSFVKVGLLALIGVCFYLEERHRHSVEKSIKEYSERKS